MSFRGFSMEENKEDWYSSYMNQKGNVVLKLLNEKYTDYVIEVSNIHMDDDGSNILFDVKEFPEELENDDEYVGLIQKAIGDIVTKAIVALQADQAKAEHTLQDIYFTNIFKANHIHAKTELPTSQILRLLKLYPVPLIEGDELLPQEGAEIEEYVEAARGISDYMIADLETNKEYKMTEPKEVEEFIKVLKERGSDYVF